MNIFPLDTTPKASAEAHCNKHVCKMQTESAQMLSGKLRTLPFMPSFVMEGAYPHHPCSLWVKRSWANFYWLARLGYHLHKQYNIRYPSNNKYKRESKIFRLALIIGFVPSLFSKLTTFVQAMPKQYLHPNHITAYRAYYINEKKRFAKYTNVAAPAWLGVSE